MENAIIVKSNDKYEVRCANCGKLLFTYNFSVDKSVETVDKVTQKVIIVSRCTRSGCRSDNIVTL